jgi:ubiquinone/menaquinone biosynthesis C-methylase UbiE
MKHAMVIHLCDGKLHFAPLDNPQNILDIGTGTGIWAIDSKFHPCETDRQRPVALLALANLAA